MELKDLLKHLQRRFGILISITLLFCIGGGVLARLWPVTQTASLALYIQKDAEQSPLGDYTYDGYYAQQAAEAYTDTVVGLLESPDVMAEVLDQLEVDRDTRFNEFHRSLKVEKTAPQIVLVSVTRQDVNEANQVVTQVADSVIKRVSTLNEGLDNNLTVSLIGAEPLVQSNELPFLLTIIVAGLFGITLGGFGILCEYYLTEDE